MKENWDVFWDKSKGERRIFGKFLSFYRREIIGRAVNYYINRYFDERGIYVECGSGSSETTLRTDKKKREFIALDYSDSALKIAGGNPRIDRCVKADMFSMQFQGNSIDGIWNVGVMEHYSMKDIDRLLREFRRILKDNGKVILFWPMRYAPYEILIDIVEFVSKKILRKPFKFYVDEISRLRSKKQAREILEKNDFRDVKAFFNFRDAFSFVVVIGSK